MQKSLDIVVLRPATSLADFLFTRKLRNQIFHFLTGLPQRVGFLQQLRFYWNRPPGIELFIAELHGLRAGYLLIRHQGPQTFVTEAVDPNFRRQGVASSMLTFAVCKWPHITAEIRSDNHASCALHASMGFKVVQQTKDLVTMQHRLTRNLGEI